MWKCLYFLYNGYQFSHMKMGITRYYLAHLKGLEENQRRLGLKSPMKTLNYKGSLLLAWITIGSRHKKKIQYLHKKHSPGPSGCGHWYWIITIYLIKESEFLVHSFPSYPQVEVFICFILFHKPWDPSSSSKVTARWHDKLIGSQGLMGKWKMKWKVLEALPSQSFLLAFFHAILLIFPSPLKMHMLVIASGKRPCVLPCHSPLSQWLCWEQFCFPGYAWQHLEIFLVVANGRWSTVPGI